MATNIAIDIGTSKIVLASGDKIFILIPFIQQLQYNQELVIVF